MRWLFCVTTGIFFYIMKTPKEGEKMKKLTAFLLATVIALSLCACAGGAENKKEPKLEGLCVGFAKENITPDFEVGLSGYSNGLTRRFNGKVNSYI